MTLHMDGVLVETRKVGRVGRYSWILFTKFYADRWGWLEHWISGDTDGSWLP